MTDMSLFRVNDLDLLLTETDITDIQEYLVSQLTLLSLGVWSSLWSDFSDRPFSECPLSILLYRLPVVVTVNLLELLRFVYFDPRCDITVRLPFRVLYLLLTSP